MYMFDHLRSFPDILIYVLFEKIENNIFVPCKITFGRPFLLFLSHQLNTYGKCIKFQVEM